MLINNNVVKVEKYTVQLSSFPNIDEKRDNFIFSIWGYISETRFMPKIVMCIR